MSDNRYQKAVKQHGSARAAAEALGIARTTFRNRLAEEKAGIAPKPPGRPRAEASRSKAKTGGLSAEELLLKHSPEHQIAHAAEQLVEGVYVAEAEFIRNVGISGGYRHIVDREEFSKYRGKASGNVVYWSHPDSIKAMKEQRVLR